MYTTSQHAASPFSYPNETSHYFAEVADALGGTLDLQTSCEATADLLVPRWAQGCTIDLNRDGRWQRVAARAPSREKTFTLSACGLEPSPGNLPKTLSHFLEAGVPQAITDADFLGRLIGVGGVYGCSATAYPLVADSSIFGILTLLHEEPGFVHAPQAARLLASVVRYASVVMDNGRLFAQAYAARMDAHRAQTYIDVLALARQSLGAAPTLTEALRETTRIATAHLATCCIIDFAGLCASDRNVVLSHANPTLEMHLQTVLMANPDRLPTFSQDAASAHMVLDALLESVHTLSVPVSVRDTVCGTATFVRSLPNAEPFTTIDRQLAHELVACFADATDRRWLNQELESAVRTREEFLCIASHELRTPLTALELHLGNLARLAGRSDPTVWQPRMQDKLKSASRQTGRLTKIIDNLLDVANINAGRLDLAPVPMQVHSFCADLIEQWSEEALAARCTLSLQCDVSLTTVWDADRMEQVLAHLLANAIKYGAGKPIILSVTDNAEAILLRVRDHGIGVAHQAAERIFDQYERAVSPREFGGLGLGLYISREIVEAHGGTIYVRTQDHDGAEFEIAMPKTPRAPVTTAGGLSSKER